MANATRMLALGLLAVSAVSQAQQPAAQGPQPANVLQPQVAALVEPAAAPTAAVTPAAVTVPAGTTPLAIPAPQESLDRTMLDLASLQAQVAHSQVEMQLLSQQMAMENIRRQMGGQVTGTSDIPELLGITGVPGKLVAEFLSSGSLLTAGVGEWVTPEWKLVNIMSNGVDLTKKNGRERHTILFGHRSAVGNAGAGMLTPAFAAQPASAPYPAASTPPRAVPVGPQTGN